MLQPRARGPLMLDYIYEMRHDKLQRKPFIQAASQRLGKDIGVPFIPCFLFSSSKFGGTSSVASPWPRHRKAL